MLRRIQLGVAMYFRQFLVIACVMLLSSCEDLGSVRGICKKFPELCDDLNKDGWCRYERADLIKQRYQVQVSPSGDNKYQLLMHLEDYRDCIERASQIQHSNNKEQTTQRVNGYLAALAQIEKVSAETEGDTTSDLLYYHWSRHGDKKAHQLLLEQDAKGLLERTDMQMRLASAYSKSEPQVAVNKLYKALYLSQGESKYQASIITMLATIFTQQRKNELAYLWMKIGELAEVESIDIEANSRYLRVNTEQRRALDQRAEEIYDTLKEGKFSLPEPKI
ncbi:DUF2989 domain-containing protein [Corallincola spongiicola]|uniref:DUF2989 domain-containing protein n=2 Tax=Corallincola spongiicola TaxID=2520508 RepID=A0ABY1WUP4_9GAMM|nr:DUF2989 domain-containing protein [Corallincola spongiicola]